jgi:adenylate kinase
LKRVILIMGTPCVGKTAVSLQLAKELKAVHVDLGKLVTDEKLSSGEDKKRGTLIADTTRLAKRVKQIIEDNIDKKDIIIDGHYATDVVDSETVAQAFVLRRHPRELRQLMTERGWQEEKIRENLAAEILDVCLFDAVKAVGSEKVCEIDATGKNPQEVVHEIIQVLDGKGPCTSGDIDWLGKLEQVGQLDDYLREF